jgi:hypothetical protein
MNLKHLIAGTLMIAPLTSAQAQLQAGSGMAPETRIKAEALGRCLVNKTTGEDRVAIATWMLLAMASTPQLAGAATVEPGRKEQADRAMAQLLTRLMTIDCLNYSRAMFESESREAFHAAGVKLAQIAMNELLNNPQADAALGAYLGHVNEADFVAVNLIPVR